MFRRQKRIACLFFGILVFSVLLIPQAECCKDIVVASPATAGEYSLLLKVRDPSREGLQVLCRVPRGTLYTYQHPWTGRPWEFMVNRSFIGVATKGDTPPNIVKAGMVFTDAGLAFGDADTMSRWVNPTKNAWDDFDWIRYACQSAKNEEEAIHLLTTEAVDELHATGVSENLFVVGPKKAVVIEADARQYTIRDVPDVCVMSNYAKDLWKTQLVRSLPIASSFDASKETWVRKGTIVHLGSLCGVRIVETTESSMTARVFPAFAFHQSGLDQEVTVPVGERRTIGPYSARLLEVEGRKARISICTGVYAWEQALQNQIQPTIGNITIRDMIRWSRFHATDLEGLRPMCEDRYTFEATMIYKIPLEHAGLLSSGWFAANHACSSIYVPIHICDDDFYDAYETGEAANLSLALLQRYGHGNLTGLCQSVEEVFFFENEINEYLASLMILSGMNITPFLTEVDMYMQEQAYLTQQLWLYAPNATRRIIDGLWAENYDNSLERMRHATLTLSLIQGSEPLITIIEQIMKSIVTSSNITIVIQTLHHLTLLQEHILLLQS